MKKGDKLNEVLALIAALAKHGDAEDIIGALDRLPLNLSLAAASQELSKVYAPRYHDLMVQHGALSQEEADKGLSADLALAQDGLEVLGTYATRRAFAETGKPLADLGMSFEAIMRERLAMIVCRIKVICGLIDPEQAEVEYGAKGLGWSA